MVAAAEMDCCYFGEEVGQPPPWAPRAQTPGPAEGFEDEALARIRPLGPKRVSRAKPWPESGDGARRGRARR